MKLFLGIIWIVSTLPALLPAQQDSDQRGELQGVVQTVQGETLPGVHLLLPELMRGTNSDREGRFQITDLPAGEYELRVSMVGFRTTTQTVRIEPDRATHLTIELIPLTVEADAVVVTASRRSQLAGRVPVSMSTVTADEIESRNVTSLDQVLHYVPGVQVTGNQVNIRGSSGFAYGVGNRVLLLVDGVPLMGPDQENLDFEGMPFTQVERIEVLKSPGSALYGGGALGGVINLITRDFPDQPQTSIRLISGAWQPVRYEEWRSGWDGADRFRPHSRLTLGHARQLGERFGFWASGMVSTDAGYLQMNRERSGEGYVKFGGSIRDGMDLYLYSGIRRSQREQFLYWNGLNDVLSHGTIDLGTDEVTGANDGLSDRLTVMPVFNHRIGDDLNYSVRGRLFGVAFRPLDDQGNIRPRHTHTYGLRYGGEAQVNSSHLRNTELTGGVSFDANWVESEFFVGEDSLTVRNQPEGALFLQADYQWSDHLTVSTGLRYDAYRVHTREVASRLSPKAGISYSLSRTLTARASYGHGFRVPSVAERFVSNRDFLPLESNVTLRPERSVGYEAGLTHRIPLGDRYGLSTEVTGFWNEYEDLVEPQFDTGQAAFRFVNLTQARIRGVEVTSNLSSIDRTRQIRLSYTWLDAYDRTLDLPLLYRSEHLFQASGRIFVTDWLETGADFRAASQPERVDTDFSRFVPDADVFPTVYVTDLRVRIHYSSLPGIELSGSLHLNNIFDYYYVDRPAFFAPPRNFQAVLDVRF